MANLVSVHVGRLRIPDSYRCLSASFQKIIQRVQDLPHMDNTKFSDPFPKKK